MDIQNLQYQDSIYRASVSEPSILDVPTMSFLMIDGDGLARQSPLYAPAVDALSGMSNSIRFTLKKNLGAADLPVFPLECLSWTAVVNDESEAGKKEEGKWTLLMRQPEQVSRDLVADTRKLLRIKRKMAALDLMRFGTFSEGRAAQIMHVGPLTQVDRTHACLLKFLQQNGYKPRGKRHEIYLGDFARTEPMSWTTIVRQPIQ